MLSPRSNSRSITTFILNDIATIVTRITDYVDNMVFMSDLRPVSGVYCQQHLEEYVKLIDYIQYIRRTEPDISIETVFYRNWRAQVQQVVENAKIIISNTMIDLNNEILKGKQINIIKLNVAKSHICNALVQINEIYHIYLNLTFIPDM